MQQTILLPGRLLDLAAIGLLGVLAAAGLVADGIVGSDLGELEVP